MRVGGRGARLRTKGRPLGGGTEKLQGFASDDGNRQRTWINPILLKSTWILHDSHA